MFPQGLSAADRLAKVFKAGSVSAPWSPPELSMADGFAARLESRSWLSVTGPDAAKFLQDLVSNDVDRAGSETAVYAALLTPQGKFLFEFFIARFEDGFWLDVDKARSGDLTKRLQMYKLRAKVEIKEQPNFGIVAFWGEPPSSVAPRPIPDPRLAALGWRARMNEEAASGLQSRTMLVPESNYHKHRIALGVPDGAMDLEPEQTFLLEGNFEELNGVDFKKGCYVGQELTARMKHRGTARRRLLPVRGDRSLPHPGTTIVDESGREIGELRGAIAEMGMAGFRLDRLKEARQLKADGVTLSVQRPAYSVIGWEEKPS
jgi:folate-binding protein YgfZ